VPGGWIIRMAKAASKNRRTPAGVSAQKLSDRGPLPAEARMYDDLILAVIDQRLRPGTRLNEVHFAKSYGLARPRVRRVLNRLAENSIVDFRLNLGAFIRRPSPEEARSVYQARRFLESGIVETIASRPAGRDLSRLRAFVSKESAAYRNPKPGVHRLSSEFHVLLAEVADNQVVKEMLVGLIHRCCLIQALYMTQAGAPCLVHDHDELIQHLEAGNVRAALRVHHRHFDHIEASLRLEREPDTLLETGSAFSELAV
jgi:DNA-binding GntR family transcriptional regulator